MGSYKIYTVRFVILALELVTLFLIFDAFTNDVGTSKAFTWHPILMTTSVSIFMNEGLLQYYMGDILKRERSESRTGHAILQIFGCLLCIAGYVAVFIAHAQQKKSQFFSDSDEFLKKLHVCIGYLVLIFVLIQFSIGIMKYYKKKQYGQSLYQWHGKTGFGVYGKSLLKGKKKKYIFFSSSFIFSFFFLSLWYHL